MRRAKFLQSGEPESVFIADVLEIVAARRGRGGVKFRPSGVDDAVFHPLLLGYNGAGNTGSDVRVVEILRQCRAIFGRENFRPGAVFVGSTVTHPMLRDLEPLPLAGYFPDILEAVFDRYDGVIACEGSMFTSTFSDMLAATLIGGVAYAAAAGKPAIAYGVEAGRMNERLKPLAAECREGTQLLCRNAASAGELRALDLTAEVGADTAWTFEPAKGAGRAALRMAGWDGTAPLAVVCPINPFWWPIKVDLAKYLALEANGSFKDLHYQGVLFLSDSEEAREKQRRYLASLAEAVLDLQRRGYFVVLVGMERLDARACGELNALLSDPLPQLVSGNHDLDTLVGVLRAAALVISSRFHGTVLAMAGGVPTIGVSMDTRIAKLFAENGLDEWVVACDRPELAEWLQDAVGRLEGRIDAVKRTQRRLHATQLRAIGEMGRRLAESVTALYPNLPVRSRSGRWQDYLPPLSDALSELVDDLVPIS